MNKRNISRILLVLAMAAAIAAAFTFREDLNPASLEARMDDFGALAPLVFMALFALATVLFLPGSVFALAGGALFGPVLGTVYNLSGATIGAIIAFFIARYLASDWVARKAGGKLRLLIDGVENEGWRFVAFTRLVPLFPFNLLNYALGLTRIKPLAYVAATAISMIPGAIAYTYLGYAGREAIAGSEGAIQKGLLALGLLATAVFIPRLIKRLRKVAAINVTDLRRRLDSDEDILLLDVRDGADFTGEHGHVPQAANMPLSALPDSLDRLHEHRDRTVAVMCFTERKSKAAIALLRDNGFTGVVLVSGGMKAWNNLGLPAE